MVNGEHLTGNEQDLVQRVTFATSCLSVVGTLLTIAGFLHQRHVTRELALGKKLWLILSVMDLFMAVAYALPGASSEGRSAVCKAQALMITFFEGSSLLWTGTIALYLYMRICTSRSSMRWCHVAMAVSVTWPILATILQAVYNSVGYAGNWCWVPATMHGATLWRLFLIYIPMWSIVLFCTITYIMISVHIRRTLKITPLLESEARERVSRQLRVLLFIPLLLILLRVWGSANRIHDILYPDKHIFWLYVAQAVGDPGQGFFNGILYLSTWPSVRRVLCCDSSQHPRLSSEDGREYVASAERLNTPTSESMTFR